MKLPNDYLGDGLYVDDEHGAQLRLHTMRDMEHEVFLDRETLQALVNFAVKHGYPLVLPEPAEPEDSLIFKMTESAVMNLAWLRNKAKEYEPIYNLLTDRLKERFDPCGSYFDLNHLSREEVLEAMQCLKAGKWEKSASSMEGCLDYKAEVLGVSVRLWGAAPPGSCRMVEVLEEVPALPATTRKVRKLICGDATDEAAGVVPAKSDSDISF